jgi:hypothetical protein
MKVFSDAQVAVIRKIVQEEIKKHEEDEEELFRSLRKEIDQLG